ncbi:MAG: copper resistance protein CopC [Kineosporiaceae bacterium]|nr:copper resistance protein CopC [Aeromicrobium sp.]
MARTNEVDALSARSWPVRILRSFATSLMGMALIGLVALSACLVLGATPASAHAALVSTDPGDGVRLKTAPTKVTLEFNEDLASPAYVVITAPDGSRVKTGTVNALGKTVTATVEPADLKGTYSMSYRVVSDDGHPVAGGTTFDVTSGRTVSPVAPAEQESFTQRHQGLLLGGFAAAVVVVGLLLWPLRRRHE